MTIFICFVVLFAIIYFEFRGAAYWDGEESTYAYSIKFYKELIEAIEDTGDRTQAYFESRLTDEHS